MRASPLRLIAAVRKRDHRGPAPGAVETQCPGCGEIILLSRASQKRIRLGYIAACGRCLERAMPNGPNAVELPTPEELADARGFGEKN